MTSYPTEYKEKFYSIVENSEFRTSADELWKIQINQFETGTHLNLLVNQEFEKLKETDSLLLFGENNYDTTYHIIKTEDLMNDNLADEKIRELEHLHKLLWKEYGGEIPSLHDAYYVFPKSVLNT